VICDASAGVKERKRSELETKELPEYFTDVKNSLSISTNNC
jgi:hypothetical protein